MTTDADVVVVGAGVSGLTAAYALHVADPTLRVEVLDGADRIGGKLLLGEVGGVRVDLGAEALLARRPEAVELAAELGLAVRHPATTTAAVALGGGRLAPLPAGSVMGVPTDVDTVAGSGVLTATGQLRLAERRTGAGVLAGDVSVAEALTPRLGPEVVDRLVEPLLAGVYAGRADRLSLAATVPNLYAALREEPDAIAAAQAIRPPATGAPVFFAPEDGVGSLPAALLAASGADLRLRCPVRRLERTAAGFAVEAGPAPDPVRLTARAVVVAAPAPKAAVLLHGVAPGAATALDGVVTASLALVVLALPPDTDLTGSGFLVPGSVGTAVKAGTYLTTKWPQLRRPGDPVVVRLSVGRVGAEQVLQRDDTELAALARADLAALTGITAAPVDVLVARWGGGLPQYDVGHLDRVAAARGAAATVPGLALAGAAYDGVGVPACVGSGRRAARMVLDHLGRKAP